VKPNCLIRVASVLVLASAALTAQVARQGNEVPLRNWATPLYWQPNQAERAASGGALPQLQFSANAISTDALTFVAITPCRLVDTRGSTAGFSGVTPFNGPGAPAGGGTLTFPVQSSSQTSTSAPAPCGAIPSIAEAYSVNLTVVPAAAGAVDNVTLWPAGATQPVVATLNDPQGIIAQNAAIVPAGTPYGGISFHSTGPAAVDVIIDMNGYFTAPTDLLSNTALGTGTLATNAGGTNNTAVGVDALMSNLTGSYNTASGFDAMQNTTLGASYNTASGAYALQHNTSGGNNTASGFGALQANTTGASNTAFGYEALYGNTVGTGNTAVGAFADAGTGSNNIVIGVDAGTSIGAGSNNIIIGGGGGGSNTISIGSPGIQTSATIAGIYGSTASSGTEVIITSGGQLGTVTSSRRFKEQITDMGDGSSKLFQLRPVNFFYKPEYDDGSHLLQYGLIAEEVAKVYPEMVAYDNDGQILTVRYQMLAPMLLNEVQKQNAELQKQAEINQRQWDQNQKLEEQNQKLEDRLAALEALLSSQTSASQTPAAMRPAGSQ
jgi:hypothetical protein